MPAPAALRVRGSSSPRVALALGSGGARGYAHIGVIQALRERGYDIVGIAGSSMGAVVGGVHAAGRLDEFAHWAKSLTQRTILRLLDPSISAAGILRAEKILDAVRDIVGPVAIEQLPIPIPRWPPTYWPASRCGFSAAPSTRRSGRPSPYPG